MSRLSSGNNKKNIDLAARRRPSFVVCSPKTGGRSAERRMPSIVRACANKCTQVAPLVCCAEAALYPPPLPLAGEGREGDRSPSGASPRLLLRRPNATAQLRAALPGITGCERVLPLPGPVQRAPRRPVLVPAGRGPEAARARTVSFRARAPHLAPLSGVPSRRRPWRARFFHYITEMGTMSMEKGPTLSASVWLLVTSVCVSGASRPLARPDSSFLSTS